MNLSCIREDRGLGLDLIVILTLLREDPGLALVPICLIARQHGLGLGLGLELWFWLGLGLGCVPIRTNMFKCEAT